MFQFEEVSLNLEGEDSKVSESDVHEITNCGNQTRMKGIKAKDDRGAKEASHGKLIESRKTCQLGEEEKTNKLSESRFHRALHCPIMPEKTTSLCHGGHKFHEVFQLKQGCFSNIPASKISEIIKSNGLENAPIQSLLSVINGILDESNNRKNGELPLRVASLLRKIVQEIERRISSQAAHIRNQNNLIKAREEKYQSRIKVLETWESGTNEETKEQKYEVEENKKQGHLHVFKEENSDQIIVELKKELEIKNNTYERHCQQLEVEAKKNEARLQERIKEVEFLLSDSSKRLNEAEVLSAKFENCNKKGHVFNNFLSFQLQSLKGLGASSESIKAEVIDSQRKWREEMNSMAVGLKVLVDAAENYHTVLAENRKLYNEVQELKGNIRVYCRVRPFLPRQNANSTTVDYIGQNGELVLANPIRQGKDGHRMFKFNKVFGPNATQDQVFLDIRPLIRSVLDGYNVCIFAYGQTGSGKTYTMSGPESPSEEELGVNYRALNDLFHISKARRNAYTFEISVQMVEIYNEQIRDLLSNSVSQKRLGILSSSQPHGLAVPDASMIPVKSTSEVMGLMEFGQKNRAVGSTALNERSSRSHCILTVHVRGVDLKIGSTSRGCLHLIDLAGSERVDRSEIVGDRLKEAQHINKSLSALGDAIFALSQKSAHVPYRNSKLTQILQSSLGGQAKTLMFVHVNPDGESYPETLSTLKFAERVSGVELGAPRSTKEGKDVKDLIEQVASLKDTIARKDDEIEQLQALKDLRTQSPRSNSLRQISSLGVSSFGEVTQQGGGKVAKLIEKDIPNAEIFSKVSTQNLDACSQLSIVNRENADDDCYVDEESGDRGDAESDERLSDESRGVLFLEEEAECLTVCTIESPIHSEAVNSLEIMTEKIPKPPTRIPKPHAQRTGQAMPTRAISNDSESHKSKNTTSNKVAASLIKQMKS